DPRQHGLPPFPAGLVAKVPREPVQVEFSLGLLPPVTGLAVLDEERTDLLVVLPGGGPFPARRLLPGRWGACLLLRPGGEGAEGDGNACQEHDARETDPEAEAESTGPPWRPVFHAGTLTHRTPRFCGEKVVFRVILPPRPREVKRKRSPAG